MSLHRPVQKGLKGSVILAYIILTILLTACGSTTQANSVKVDTTKVSTAKKVIGSQTTSPYPTGAGQIVIRLINSPGFIRPSMNALPRWTLYGDGTLIYQTSTGGNPQLNQAHLQPSEITHILDVIINQNTFFADKKSTYGKPIPDIGSLLLTVNTREQQKTVSLFSEKGALATDGHMFAILHFLQSYHPASSQPYVAPGVVVLAISAQGTTQGVQWPYSDISLQQIAAQECQVINGNTSGNCSNGNETGLFPIYGKRGTDLLNQQKQQWLWTVSQKNQSYSILIWPLLPENLIAHADGKQWVDVEGFNGGKWPLLPGTH